MHAAVLTRTSGAGRTRAELHSLSEKERPNRLPSLCRSRAPALSQVRWREVGPRKVVPITAVKQLLTFKDKAKFDLTLSASTVARLRDIFAHAPIAQPPSHRGGGGDGQHPRHAGRNAGGGATASGVAVHDGKHSGSGASHGAASSSRTASSGAGHAATATRAPQTGAAPAGSQESRHAAAPAHAAPSAPSSGGPISWAQRLKEPARAASDSAPVSLSQPGNRARQQDTAAVEDASRGLPPDSAASSAGDAATHTHSVTPDAHTAMRMHALSMGSASNEHGNSHAAVGGGDQPAHEATTHVAAAAAPAKEANSSGHAAAHRGATAGGSTADASLSPSSSDIGRRAAHSSESGASAGPPPSSWAALLKKGEHGSQAATSHHSAKATPPQPATQTAAEGKGAASAHRHHEETSASLNGGGDNGTAGAVPRKVGLNVSAVEFVPSFMRAATVTPPLPAEGTAGSVAAPHENGAQAA